jgi:hypothetical protein
MLEKGALMKTFARAAWVAAWAAAGAGCAARPAGRPSARLFEIRTYTAHPGKMEALHRRFREHTHRLFLRHGIEPVGYWTVSAGEGAETTLVFLLAYPSREAREAAWKAFQADPEWQRAKAESEREGPLVARVDSRFLTPADYSPLR